MKGSLRSEREREREREFELVGPALAWFIISFNLERLKHTNQEEAVDIEYGNIENGNIEKKLTSRRGHRI